MHRQSILELLTQYQEKNPKESEVTTRFIDFVNANSDCFERSLEIGHVTGSAWVVNEPGTHVLLTHHKKLNKWYQLGGHADGESDILKAALVEVDEESGLADFSPISKAIFDIDIHAIPARKNEPEHYHYDVRFAVRVTGADDYVVSEESHDLNWVEVSKLSYYTQEESMLRMGRKWLGMA